jgi:hypothetical protein
VAIALLHPRWLLEHDGQITITLPQRLDAVQITSALKGSPVVSVGQFTRSGSGGQRLERVSIASAINAVAE